MQEFIIIKKNRKYFSATKNGYNCKILIDEKSQDLPLGHQTLEVEDISVRSKYGTDLIFKLSATAEEVKDAGICTLKTPFFNTAMNEECRRLGGKWGSEEKAWIFSGMVADEVEELDEIYNSPLVETTITFTREGNAKTAALFLAGFKIATAWGRDSGAKLADGIALISGSIYSSGSVKNWYTSISEGAVIRMMIPSLVLPQLDEIDFITYTTKQ